jgi:hypothetical protein
MAQINSNLIITLFQIINICEIFHLFSVYYHDIALAFHMDEVHVDLKDSTNFWYIKKYALKQP